MSDLEAVRDELQAKVVRIDTQLTQRRYAFEKIEQACRQGHPPEFGRLQDARLEYNAWRAKALGARQHALEELAAVRAQIKAENVAADELLHRRRYHDLRAAVIAHRQKVYDAGYAPTGPDNELWDMVDEYDAEDQRK
jgi:hypothetical protein